MRRGREAILIVDRAPSFVRPLSQACSAAQFSEPAMKFWCDRLHIDHRLHREVWERCYAAQALASHGRLAPGRKGLCLETPDLQMPRLFRSYGCSLVVAHSDAARVQEWMTFDPKTEWADRAFELRHPLAGSANGGDFDFIWSSKSMAQQGSIAAGRQMVEAALSWLAPGGVAVFTLDYVCDDNYTTELPFWGRHHLLNLLDDLARRGFGVAVNLHQGADAADRDVDQPPYRSEPHIKVMIGDRIYTSFGIIVSKEE